MVKIGIKKQNIQLHVPSQKENSGNKMKTFGGEYCYHTGLKVK